MTAINIKNISLNYTEAGDSNNPTIVFTHPMLWGAETFTTLLSTLADDFHIIAIDIHGHGQSSYRQSLTLDEMTDDFYQLIKELNLQNITWFGYSIGGMIGMRMALAHPEVLSSLVLMATNARLDPPEIKQATLRLWELFRDGHRADIADPALKFFFAQNTYKNKPEIIEQFRDKLINFQDVGGMFEAALAAFERDDISDRIRAIKVPTLVIAGGEDPSATAQEAEFIAARIPHSQLSIIEETNHLLAVEKPHEVAEVIRRFLKTAK